MKWCFSCEIRRVRIRPEIMIKRDVLLEDHDDMLDWRLRRRIVFVASGCWVHGQKRHGRSGHNCHSPSKAVMHRKSLLGILSLEPQMQTQGADALAEGRGLRGVTARFPAYGV